MAEQIQTTNINNPFTRFKPIDGQSFYVTQKYLPKQEEKSDEFVAAEQNVIPEHSELPTKKRNNKKYTYAVGTSALVVGVGVLALMRGLPKGTSKFLEKIKTFLEEKIEKSSENGTDKLREFYVYSLRKIETFMDKTQSINNITSIKDAIFKHFMEKTSFTAKIHSGITSFFEKISRRTIVNAYKTTKNKFVDFDKAFAKLDEKLLSADPERIVTYNGQQYKVKDLIEIAKDYRKNVMTSVTDFMSDAKLQERYDYIKSATDNLYQQFWDENFSGNLREFFSRKNKLLRKEMWQTYITAEKIVESKQKLVNSVSAVRNKISYAPSDKAEIIKKQLKLLERTISPSEFATIKKLKWYIKDPAGIEGTNEETILLLLDKLKTVPANPNVSEQVLKSQQAARTSHIEAITGLLTKHDSGELQKMLDIYKTIGAYETSQVENKLYKAIKSFDKSLDLETVQFFSKASDLQLGSAPTDVLSILASGGMIGYGLCKAKNSDERWEVTLTSGIPIVGAIGTSLVCAAKLISGGKSLATALASGFVLKYVGEFANYLRLKSQNGAKSPEKVAQ